jgi:hypothetical protein
MGQAALTPTPPVGSGGGCMALTPHLCIMVWPHKLYSTSILAAGGNDVVMANYFLVTLIGTAWSWLMNLPEGSLTS